MHMHHLVSILEGMVVFFDEPRSWRSVSGASTMNSFQFSCVT